MTPENWAWENGIAEKRKNRFAGKDEALWLLVSMQLLGSASSEC